MNWELSVLHWFESLHNPVLDPVMKGLTFLGNAGCFWIALAVVLLFFKRTRKIGITMAVSLVLSLIFTNLIIKNLVNRTRPFVADPALLQTMLVKLPSDSSFPSGHTSASVAAAVAIFTLNKNGVFRQSCLPCLSEFQDYILPYIFLPTLLPVSYSVLYMESVHTLSHQN